MSCPFLDSDHPGCSRHLTMQNLDEAYRVCTDLYMLCPIYIKLNIAASKSAALEPLPNRSKVPEVAQP